MNNDSMSEVYTLMREQLDHENGDHLKAQLVEIEAWGAYVSSEARKAQRTLAEARKQYLMPKDKGITEMDREIDLAGRVGDLQQASDILKDMADNINRRISLGQSMMKSMRSEQDHGLR